MTLDPLERARLAVAQAPSGLDHDRLLPILVGLAGAAAPKIERVAVLEALGRRSAADLEFGARRRRRGERFRALDLAHLAAEGWQELRVLVRPVVGLLGVHPTPGPLAIGLAALLVDGGARALYYAAPEATIEGLLSVLERAAERCDLLVIAELAPNVDGALAMAMGGSLHAQHCGPLAAPDWAVGECAGRIVCLAPRAIARLPEFEQGLLCPLLALWQGLLPVATSDDEASTGG
jgi:hypothetical protein